MKLPIKDITIGERQRIDLGDLSDLDSMSDPEIGLIQPIIVHKTLTGFELVAGRRRLAKATALGWDSVSVEVKDQLTETQKNKMELVEDIARKDRSWQEVAVATYKLFRLIKNEKVALHQSWTIRAMSVFTGFSKSSVHNALDVADFLLKVPKDEELWKAGSYFEACKILVQRTEAEARKEEERRRQANLQQSPKQKPLIVEETSGEPVVEENLSLGSVQTLDKTPSDAPRKLRIFIQGHNMRYEDQKVEDLAGTKTLILIHKWESDDEDQIKKINTILEADLRPEGWVVTWNCPDIFGTGWMMPHFPLIWNTLKPSPSPWPFGQSHIEGQVIMKARLVSNNFQDPTGSVITAPVNDDGSLPSPVVEFSMRTTISENMAVVLIGNIDPISVVEHGRIPIFFEPDKEKFIAKCNALKEHYEANIPDVEVILPSIE